MKHLEVWAVAAALLLLASPGSEAAPAYPWLGDRAGQDLLCDRIRPPAGYERIGGSMGSFTSWLRGLPLRRAGTAVRLFDGREKSHQAGAFAVVDIDVGPNDLQQCADAVIRLRAVTFMWGLCIVPEQRLQAFALFRRDALQLDRSITYSRRDRCDRWFSSCCFAPRAVAAKWPWAWSFLSSSLSLSR